MKKILLILFFTTTYIHSQEFTAGVVMPNKEFKTCCFYIPNSGIKIYDKPNGNIKGEIYLGKPDNNNEFYNALIKENGIERNLDSKNLEMVGYEIMALVFIDIKSAFIKLKNGYWIRIKELKSKNLKLMTWMEYIMNKNSEWYANEPGLNLRTGPSIHHKKIVKLKGDLFGIKLTNEKKGKWCKVSVTQYRKHPCSGEDNQIIKVFSGWAKIISEEKTLNVWNYTKGC